MERSFLDYAMSVITARALPDARDGLKPVHRRILWGMSELNARPDRPTIKCARVTGEVMGKYHPHGDSAIYDALVRMGQDFSPAPPARSTPKGNFGSLDDPPAAARYTECRLAEIAMADARRHRREHRRHGRQLRRLDATSPTVLPAAVPEPAGQRQPGHRRGHGHQHPAPQPGRGHRRRRAPPRQPRRRGRRPHAVREGPRLPQRARSSWAARGSWTPTARARARSACGAGPRSKRASATTRSSSPNCPTR